MNRDEIIEILIELRNPNPRVRPYVDRALFSTDNRRELDEIEEVLSRAGVTQATREFGNRTT
jgi:hypothetical protein